MRLWGGRLVDYASLDWAGALAKVALPGGAQRTPGPAKEAVRCLTEATG